MLPAARPLALTCSHAFCDRLLGSSAQSLFLAASRRRPGAQQAPCRCRLDDRAPSSGGSGGLLTAGGRSSDASAALMNEGARSTHLVTLSARHRTGVFASGTPSQCIAFHACLRAPRAWMARERLMPWDCDRLRLRMQPSALVWGARLPSVVLARCCALLTLRDALHDLCVFDDGARWHAGGSSGMRIACGQAGSGARDRPPCAARTRDHARLCCALALQIVESGFSQNVISVAQKQNPQYRSFVTGLSRQR